MYVIYVHTHIAALACIKNHLHVCAMLLYFLLSENFNNLHIQRGYKCVAHKMSHTLETTLCTNVCLTILQTGSSMWT